MKRPTSEIVLEAIKDLHAAEQVVTRETLLDVTGLKLSVIDDRVACLVDEGLVHRIQRGVFVPAPQHRPARMMSKTVLPDGTVSIEIGDDHVLTLTPKEHRTLGELTAAAGMQFSKIEEGHQSAILVSELTVRIRKLEGLVAGLRSLLGDKGSQLELIPSELPIQNPDAMAEC